MPALNALFSHPLPLDSPPSQAECPGTKGRSGRASPSIPDDCPDTIKAPTQSRHDRARRHSPGEPRSHSREDRPRCLAPQLARGGTPCRPLRRCPRPTPEDLAPRATGSSTGAVPPRPRPRRRRLPRDAPPPDSSRAGRGFRPARVPPGRFSIRGGVAVTPRRTAPRSWPRVAQEGWVDGKRDWDGWAREKREDAGMTRGSLSQRASTPGASTPAAAAGGARIDTYPAAGAPSSSAPSGRDSAGQALRARIVTRNVG